MNLDVLRRKNKRLAIVIISITAVFMVCSYFTEFNLGESLVSIPKALGWMMVNFIPTASALDKVPSILQKLWETILLAIASTTLAGIMALLFAVAGSKATKINNFMGLISRGIASIFRNVPDAVWAMIFLLSFGQNILTGYFALFFVSFGILTRAFIETIDEASAQTIEALKATGASYPQIIFQAVIPSTLTQMISWILYMIETNIRSSTLIGILTGTGIGFIFDLYYKSMNYSAAGLVVLSIVLTVFLIEFISNYVRRLIL